MTRAVRDLVLLLGAAAACAAVLAPSAWAGDRYGPNDGQGDGYGAPAYDSSYDSRRNGYGARYADDQRRDDRYSDGRRWDERRDSRTESYADRRYDDAEAIDPCAIQHRVVGRGCAPAADEGYRRGERAYGGGYQRRFDDAEQVDPCAMQYRVAGRGCGGGYDRETYEEHYGPEHRGDYRGERFWREGSAYDDREVWVDRQEGYDRGGYDGEAVDACEVVHERMGDHCPYAEQRIVAPVVTENLPDGFFLGDGGVGPGIVDFGGGGGGGGGFAIADSSSSASAVANASASASARVSLKFAVMAHNHHMMMGGHHYPTKGWGGGGGGCGCKK
jgi:hypothetical protein